MPIGRRLLIFGGVLVALGAAGVAAALAPAVLPIPGFAGRGIGVAGVSRLADGGGLVAGSLGGGRASRPVLVRLLVDGGVDLAYGDRGISVLHGLNGARARALAVAARSGSAWVGVGKAGGGGGVVAVDARGLRMRRFGRGGVAAFADAPVALSWQPGEVLVSSGRGSCRGCRLTLLNPNSGSSLGSGVVSPGSGSGSGSASGPGGAGCGGAAVTSAVLTSRRAAELTVRGGGGCPSQILAVATHPLRVTAAARLPAGTPLLASFGSDVCLADASSAGTVLGPLSGAFHSRRAPGGRLVAVVALGGGACAAALGRGAGGGMVIQMSAARSSVTRDRIPGAIRPLGMFRCHSHLLVIGARGDRGAVVVIPVRRGANAAAATAASERCAAA